MFFTVLLFILLIIPIVWIYFMSGNRRFRELYSNYGWPLMGNLHLMWYSKASNPLNKYFETLEKLSWTYAAQGLFKFEMGPMKTVFIYRHDHIQAILKSKVNLKKSFDYKILGQWLGNGILIENDLAKWSCIRKMLTPSFHSQLIGDFLPIFNQKGNELIEELSKLSGSKFNLCPLLSSCAFDIIWETILGNSMDSMREQKDKYIEALYRMDRNCLYRGLRPWLWPQFIYFKTKHGKSCAKDLKVFHDLSRSLIIERKVKIVRNHENGGMGEEEGEGKDSRKIFLDLLLDVHLKDNSLTLDDIRQEVDVFMFAGNETLSTAFSWAFYLIVQNKIIEELDEILTKDQEISVEHIMKIPYLEAVIKETLRMFPPASRIGRLIAEEIELGDGYVIPKGVTLNLMLPRLHMDPDVFPEPKEFRPERFLKENQTELLKYGYIPFSGGQRDCIGNKFSINEMKVILAKVLLNYVIKSLESMDELSIYVWFGSKSENGINVSISPRC